MASTKEVFGNATHALALAWLRAVGARCLGDHKVSAQCGGSLVDIEAQCSKFVHKTGPKTPPSLGCCQVIKTLNVNCVCLFVTPQVEAMISMEKVVSVARTCGVTVRAGTQCGSKVYYYLSR
ncbi:hypothetical protein NC653_022820 [Populus alba x Populus x berolinensis]|uniref:Bifunctional inhibitor/plant lipid transfer protein/seed storage helical domain-containing protein n=1 Tax=Populus alba x Populus x berolinensis TaxID=444605 RepID=A0AAD6MFS1_9ROSI|nr:hypothetical protein NC653_022820 [Populus alba x Populus x berolinensis]